MQAVGLPSLDEAPGPRLRDLPDPVRERPSFMKRRARLLRQQAACLADASTLGADPRAEIARMCGEADRLLQERTQKLKDLERAVSRPATRHTAAAWGARPGEPLPEFPRALRRTLLELGVEPDLAEQLIDTGEDQKGKGNEGGRKGKGKGKNW